MEEWFYNLTTTWRTAMADWEYTVEKLTPEIRGEMSKRTRVGTLKLQQAISDLTSRDDYLTLQLPEGITPQSAKARIKTAARAVGKYVTVQVLGETARVALSEAPPPLPEGAKRGGRKKKEATA